MYKLQADAATPQPQVQFNNFRVPQNVDADGNLIGAKRDVTKYVCPPGKVMCHCQSGGAFMELVSPDVVASQMAMPEEPMPKPWTLNFDYEMKPLVCKGTVKMM